jgi:hypothetical protein
MFFKNIGIKYDCGDPDDAENRLFLIHVPSRISRKLDAISQGPKKSRFPGSMTPLPLALVMDLYASKTLHTGPYKS